MFTRDYILRQIEQLKQAIATILRLRQEQRIEEARETLGDTYDDLLGYSREALASVTTESAAMMLGKWHRLQIYAALLDAEADLLEAQGSPRDLLAASRTRVRALQITLLGLSYGGRGDPTLADRAKELLARVDAAALDPRSRAALGELGLRR